MKGILRILSLLGLFCFVAGANSTATDHDRSENKSSPIDTTEVPTWSEQDLNFFLHGSMSTEVIPEVVLRAFIRSNPDLFPTNDLTHLGLISDPDFGWPIGFSRSKVKHLGGLSSVGINCASCHVAEITTPFAHAPIRILGATSHFDVEAYFGSVLIASFRTAEPANMKRFLGAYLAECDPSGGDEAQKLFEATWQRQEEKITAAIKADPFGARGIEAGALHQIDGNDLRFRSRIARRRSRLTGPGPFDRETFS